MLNVTRRWLQAWWPAAPAAEDHAGAAKGLAAAVDTRPAAGAAAAAGADEAPAAAGAAEPAAAPRAAAAQRHSAEDRFDNFMRSVASQATRRDALRVSAQGAFVSFMATLGLRPAHAAADCLCGRQLYDPALQCCTPTGVQNKNPIADLARCPDRVASPSYTCVPNGCGAEGGQSFPGGYGAASFIGCCSAHDCCYGTCRSNQGGCDSTFGNCMRASCDAAYPPDIVTLPGGITFDRNRVNRSLCRGQANAYEAAVVNFGDDAHTAAQQNACDCCGTQNCPTCPGGTCSSLPSCQDPGCVCFQTVEGRGFCHLPQSCAGLARCSSSSSCPTGWACVSVTCCVGSGAICIRPCFTVSGSAAQSRAAALADTGGPMTAPVSGAPGASPSR
jgi:hypothetical protein